jgi:hypothetical protein
MREQTVAKVKRVNKPFARKNTNINGHGANELKLWVKVKLLQSLRKEKMQLEKT